MQLSKDTGNMQFNIPRHLILNLSESNSCTEKVTCLAIWLVVLYHATGEQDFEIALQDVDVFHISVDISKSYAALFKTVKDCPFDKDEKKSDGSFSGGETHYIEWHNERSATSDQAGKVSTKHYSSSLAILCLQDDIRWTVLKSAGLANLAIIPDLAWRAAKGAVDHLNNPIRLTDCTSSGQLGLPAVSIRDAVAAEFAGTKVNTIPDLITHQRLATPSATAIDAWDGEMSFEELDSAISRWANRLIGSGLPHATLVMHCFDSSRWAIVAWLAILKAGLICIPLDPSIPRYRLESILNDTGCETVVTDATHAGNLASIKNVHTVDSLNSKEENLGKHGPRRRISPDDVAIMMFTSGSTGTPKGVVQTHGAIAPSVMRVAHAMQLDHDTRWLQFASFSFDASVSEILCPLSVGGRLCMAPSRNRLAALVPNVLQYSATHILLTPTVAKTFDPDLTPCLRFLALGGEKASESLLRSLTPKLDLCILYGTTETAVWDTIHRAGPNPRSHSSIGRAIGGRIWIVHPKDPTQLSPIGVPGEMCIQGREIAREYWNSPEKTALVFQANPTWLPFGTGAASTHLDRRIYRTGDVGTILADGTIYLQGRADRQIKINGQRVEPAEIEHVLQQHSPSGTQVFVDAIEIANGTRRIVAFLAFSPVGHDVAVVSNSEKDFNQAQLTQKAASKSLAPGLTPSTIIPITKVPLTQTGKVDRQCLMKLHSEHSERSGPNTSQVATKSGDDGELVETVLTDFFTERFGKNYVELAKDNDSLTEVGWTSVDAVQLSGVLKLHAKVDVSTADLLRPNLRLKDIQSACSTHFDGCIDLVQEITACQQALDSGVINDGITVFLTGANGFLGREILRQLMEHPLSPTVICLVRGKDLRSAHEKLLSTLRSHMQHSYKEPLYGNRLQVWLGDISLPQLGLNKDKWCDLFGLNGHCRVPHHIIHCGARVNWLEPFQALKDVNIRSTTDILSAILQTTCPPGFVFVSGGYLSGVDETHAQLLETMQGMPAYDQTKFVCETVVDYFNSKKARPYDRVLTFKPGFIIGSSIDGCTQTNDALWRLVKSCVLIGAFSEEDAHMWIPVAGLDTVASDVVDTVFVHSLGNAQGHPVHPCKLLHGVTILEIWNILIHFGLNLRPVQHKKWCQMMREDIEKRGKKHPLFVLQDWFESSQGIIGTEGPNVRSSSNGKPLASIWRSIEHLIKVGFFKDETSN